MEASPRLLSPVFPRRARQRVHSALSNAPICSAYILTIHHPGLSGARVVHVKSVEGPFALMLCESVWFLLFPESEGSENKRQKEQGDSHIETKDNLVKEIKVDRKRKGNMETHRRAEKQTKREIRADDGFVTVAF